MTQENKKKTPLPDKPIFEEREPEHEPTGNPGTGQHQQDIQDEKSKNKRGGNRPHFRDDINPEEVPTGDPKEYNDGEPVEEKSPKVTKGL